MEDGSLEDYGEIVSQLGIDSEELGAVVEDLESDEPDVGTFGN